MEIQYRPELARPVAGLRDRTVRQAFYQAINREELMGVMTLGLGAVADSWFPPNDPFRSAVGAIFEFPERRLRLEPVDQELAGFERCLPVRGRGGDKYDPVPRH